MFFLENQKIEIFDFSIFQKKRRSSISFRCRFVEIGDNHGLWVNRTSNALWDSRPVLGAFSVISLSLAYDVRRKIFLFTQFCTTLLAIWFTHEPTTPIMDSTHLKITKKLGNARAFHFVADLLGDWRQSWSLSKQNSEWPKYHSRPVKILAETHPGVPWFTLGSFAIISLRLAWMVSRKIFLSAVSHNTPGDLVHNMFFEK